MIRITGILTFLLTASLAHSAAVEGSGRTTTDAPNFQLKVHRASYIYLTITNFGHLANAHDLPDPDLPGELAPGAEFPGGSGLDYLFMGCLWIGAEIDTIDQYGNPVLDTLTSVGGDGWLSIDGELLPPPEGEESLWEEEIIGDEEFFAIFSDTLTDPQYVPPDPYDQRPHIPLGLKVTRNSLCWSSPGYDQLFFLNYYLENIGQRYLHNAWIGIYCDGDVLHESENPYGPEEGAQDDLCGYIQHGEYGIAWIADNDGQPYDGAYEYRSPRNVMGMILIDASEPGVQTNFNWWVSNTDSDLDWGPQLQENFIGPFPSGGYGTPGPDWAKYYVMSNGEHDYGQIWSALDHTDEGWIAPPPQANDLANGYDTRYLISFGPLDIPAGAVETLTVAFLGGRNLHVDPSNYNQYLRDNTDDSLSIAQYYENLDFSNFLEMADSAISFYENGFANIPPGPPHNFRISEWGQDHVGLAWDPVSPPNLLEYRIYRGTEPGIYDPEKITPDNFVDSVFVDSNVVDNTTYYYVILSASISGLEGEYSPEISVNTGQPQTPAGLTATPGNTQIELNWDQNPDTDLEGYIIFWQPPDGEFTIIDTSQTNYYLDTGLGNGFRYSYMIAALDTNGNVSFNSDVASAIPMAFDSGILLINSNSDRANPDYDSMAVFYENILEVFEHTIIDVGPQTLPELTSFSTLVYCREHILGQRYFQPFDNTGLLSDYLESGGNVILAGTRQVVPVAGFEGVYHYDSSQFPNRCLNLAGVDFPYLINTEFTGGESVSSLFDDFSVDTARANRIEFPPDENEGRLFGIGTLIPNDSDEVIYNYISVDPDTSNFHGRPVGFIHRTDTYNTAILEFPLYYVEEPVSYDILHTILQEFGEAPTDLDEDAPTLPVAAGLLQNYPNPFNSSTTIEFALPEKEHVKLRIYDILGRVVATPVDEELPGGRHQVTLNLNEASSGIYFYILTTDGAVISRRMALVK
jgi:hypothetical protein